MTAVLFRELSNKAIQVEIPEGVALKDSLKEYDIENALIVVNGSCAESGYIPKESDVVMIRLYPQGLIGLAIGLGVAALAAGIYAGVKLYKQKKALEKAQAELEKLKEQTGNASIDNRPFLRGASNSVATGNTQPFICGRHLFTPYTLCDPFYQITGTDGENQYTYIVLEGGFNKQIIEKVAIDDITILTRGDSSPQEGTFNLDKGQIFADGSIEIAQDGNLFSSLTQLNSITKQFQPRATRKFHVKAIFLPETLKPPFSRLTRELAMLPSQSLSRTGFTLTMILATKFQQP